MARIPEVKVEKGKKQQQVKAVVKVSELNNLFTKLEEITVLSLQPVKEYIYQNFSLSKYPNISQLLEETAFNRFLIKFCTGLTKHGISLKDFYLAVEHYKKFQRFVRENPNFLEERVKVESPPKTGRPIGF